MALDNTIEFNDAIYQEREEGLLEIRQQITEVNEIFKDLAVIVQEQGEMIDDIDSNIVRTEVSTEQGSKELKKANEYQKRTRNKVCTCHIARWLLEWRYNDAPFRLSSLLLSWCADRVLARHCSHHRRGLGGDLCFPIES